MMRSFLEKYKTSPFALIAANVSNYETIKASFAAAKEAKTGVILQIAPIQLEVQDISASTMVQLIKLVASEFDIEYSIHLDHAESFEECKDAIKAGFDSVMIDASSHSFENNIRISKEVVEYASKFNVVVEAELGSFSTKEGEESVNGESIYTNPDEVSEFINRTGIDLLAVSIGNTHGFYKGEPNINFDVLEEIQEKSSVPLVLHGSTGLSGDILTKCIQRGVFKINVFTQLDESYSQGYIKAYNEMGKMMFAQKRGQDEFQKSLVGYMNTIKEY